MFYSKVAPVQKAVARCAAAQSRKLHGGPDARYMRVWKQCGVDFSLSLKNQDPEWTRERYFYESPKLVERVCVATAAVKRKGEVPFVHAVPAASKVVMQCAEVFHPTKTSPTRPFKYLRSPTGVYGKRNVTEAAATVSSVMKATQQPGLLSVSYALTSGVKPLETAASWGFVNHFGKEQYFQLCDQLTKMFGEAGVKQGLPAHAYFVGKSRELVRHYCRLKTGDFMVLSVPKEKVDRYVYDSLEYNIPTGKSASQVAEDPEQHVRALMTNGAHMGTVLVCDETLHPDSGIAVVRANDPKEVEAFCAGEFFAPMSEVGELCGLTSLKPTAFEADQEAERAVLDKRLSELVEELSVYVKTGQFDPAGWRSTPSAPSDVPEWMP